MTRSIVLLALASLGLTTGLAHAGSLKDLGRAVTYPVKKGAHNTGKSLSQGAGTASRGINHGGQALQYPVRKTGENTSKTTHKTVQGVKK